QREITTNGQKLKMVEPVGKPADQADHGRIQQIPGEIAHLDFKTRGAPVARRRHVDALASPKSKRTEYPPDRLRKGARRILRGRRQNFKAAGPGRRAAQCAPREPVSEEGRAKAGNRHEEEEKEAAIAALAG